MPVEPRHRGVVASRPARAALVVVLAALALVAGAGPAAAHASLVTTDPVDGQSYATAPDLVRATFSEGVSVDVGGLAVRDGSGSRVDAGPTLVSDDGTTVSVALDGDLADGTYLATYRVLSADGHPVSGSWLFGVGPGAVDPSAVAAPTGDGPWELVGAVARFATYGGALVAVGLALFVALVHDGGPERRRLVALLRGAAVLGAVGALATVAVQAALLTGDGLGGATDVEVVRSVLADRLGVATLALVVGLLLAVVSPEVHDPGSSRALAVAGGLVASGSFALWGHDTEAAYRWMAVGGDVVHVAAAATWTGGLLGTAVVLGRRGRDDPLSAGSVLARFSTVAAASVVALAVAGTAMTVTETGSFADLVGTTYGRLVLTKVALLGVVLGLAAHNRWRLLPALRARAGHPPLPAAAGRPPSPGPDPLDAEPSPGPPPGTDAPPSSGPGRARALLARTVRLELAVLALVLAVTAVLVDVTPPRSATSTRVVELTAPTDTGQVEVLVTPAAPGRNQIHVQYTDDDGRPVDVATTLSIDLALPSAGIEAIQEQVVKIAPGHFVLDGNDLALPGDWTVTLAVRTDDFTEERTTFTVPVG